MVVVDYKLVLVQAFIYECNFKYDIVALASLMKQEEIFH